MELKGPERLAATVSNLGASAKPMFFKEDGSVKWRTIALIAVGAIGGAFFIPGVPVIAGMVGAAGGVLGAAILDKVKPEGLEQLPVAAPAGPAPAAAAEPEPAAEAPAPGAIPGAPARPRARR